MRKFEDELKKALEREEPSPDFVHRVMKMLPTEKATKALSDNSQTYFASRDGRTMSFISKVVTAAWYLAKPAAACWKVSSVAGSPKINVQSIKGSGNLGVGDWLETDAFSMAKIEVGKIGYVEVEPESRLRLLATLIRNHRLSLTCGGLRATIFAPPRLFFVETPSATAIDLGCAYALKVNERGDSHLHVTHGWVAMVLANRDSIVPAGAICETRIGIGPGTPFFEDASTELRSALEVLDFKSNQQPDERADALETVLSESRERDGLTLWHLLFRVGDEDRRKVYERLTALVSPPKGVTADGVLRLDKTMLGKWQERLELAWFENDPLWRKWWRGVWKKF